MASRTRTGFRAILRMMVAGGYRADPIGFESEQLGQSGRARKIGWPGCPTSSREHRLELGSQPCFESPLKLWYYVEIQHSAQTLPDGPRLASGSIGLRLSNDFSWK